MSLFKGLRLCPFNKRVLAFPYGMRDIQDVVLTLWASQQRKVFKAWDFRQKGIPLTPYLLKILREDGVNLEAIHGNGNHYH